VAVGRGLPGKSSRDIAMAGLTLAVASIASEGGRVMFIASNGKPLQRKIFNPGHDASPFQHFSKPDLCNWQCKGSGNREQRNSSVTAICILSATLRVPRIDIFVLRLTDSMGHLLTFHLNFI
jgi:hypothetical protein